MNNELEKYSPLTEATFYILLSLNTPLHGYGVIKKVELMTEGRLKLVSGTLYGALQKLQKANLISLISEDLTSKKKKMYISTESGKQLIDYEITRLDKMVKNAKNEVEV
jgi:DNA-binding PadR family transcriptional regulator